MKAETVWTSHGSVVVPTASMIDVRRFAFLR